MERDAQEEDAREEQFAYAASDVFSIAQEASADVLVRLEASELAQEQERTLRACEARQYVARLRELQTLMTARVEREIASAKSRKSLKRKLGEETSRSAQLEKRLADADEELERLRKEFDTEKIAREERWCSKLEQAVKAARETERAQASGKVEALTVKRLRSLSSEVTKLKGKLKSLQVENSSLLETLRSCIPPPSDSPSSLQPRAEKELRRLSAAAAAAAAEEESEELEGASPDSAGSYSGHGGSGSGSPDILSGLADRIKRSISERACDLGLRPRGSRRRGRFYSDEEEDGGTSLSPRREGVTAAAGEGRTLANDGAYRSRSPDFAFDVPRVGVAAVAAAAAAGSASPSVGREGTRRRWSSSSSSGSGRRRGLGSIRRLSYDAAAEASVDRGSIRTHDLLSRGWLASEGVDPAPAKPTSGVEVLKGSSRWQHQRPLGGGGGGGGGGEAGAGSNAPSLHALLASGEFYPAGRDIADGGKRISPVGLHRAGASLRWGGVRGTVELRDHNNIPSRFAESGEGWVTGDKSRLETNAGDHEMGEEEEEEEKECVGVEASAKEAGSEGYATTAGAAGAATAAAAAPVVVDGVASTYGGGEGEAGGVVAEIARAGDRAHLAHDEADSSLTTSTDLFAARHDDTAGVFSLGAGQRSGNSKSVDAVGACGGGVHGAAVGDSCPSGGTLLEPAAALSEGSLFCLTTSAGVYGAKNADGKGGGDGERGNRQDSSFPPITGASAEDAEAATAAAIGADREKQRPALDDLLRDMQVAVPVEGLGEGDNAGGSGVTALPHRAGFVDVVLA